MNKLRLLGGFVGLMALACGTAWSQAYPAKPVRVVVVFAPGGATDVVGRIVFQRVSEQLNQQFVIDNRAGASGTIGAALVAAAPADGYTVMVYSTTLLASAHIYKNLPYDTMKDFTGLSPVARLVLVLTVHPSMPVRTTKELIALAKSRPGEITYGSAGVGALQHLATSLFANDTGIKMIHVPYKGGGPASVGISGGEIQLLFTPISEVLSIIKSGRVRPIAVSSAARVSQLPDISTIGETVKGFELTSWMGTFVHSGTPKAIVDKLNAEIKKAVEDPETAAKLSAQTLDPMYMTVDDFAKTLKSDYERYGRVVKLAGARIN